MLGVTNGAYAVAAIGSMMALVGAGGEKREGVRMGLWGAAQAFAFGIGGFLGTLASDIARYLLTSPALSYAVVFASEAGLFVVVGMHGGLGSSCVGKKRDATGFARRYARSRRRGRSEIMSISEIFDVVVVGGGPSGATAAHDLANLGRTVLLLDRAGRIKPCGGAIPPRLIRDFDIPDHLLVARVNSARMVSPSDQQVDMPIDGGFVGMVDRDEFDEWLRERAATAGAKRRTGTVQALRTRRGRQDHRVLRGTCGRRLDGRKSRSCPRADRRGRSLVGRGAPMPARRRPAALRLCLSRDRSVAADRIRASTARVATSITAARCRRISMAGYFRTATPSASAPVPRARDFRCAMPSAACGMPRAWKLRDHPPRGRADPAASVAAMGQRPQRPACRRCRRRRGAGVGRRHLLRHDRRTVVGRSGRSVPGNRRCAGRCAPRASDS